MQIFLALYGFFADSLAIGRFINTVRPPLARLAWLIPATRRGHARRIRDRFGSLPFVYKPREGERHAIAAEYVPATLIPLNRKTLAPHGAFDVTPQDEWGTPTESRSWDDNLVARLLLQQHPKALILGAPGIGKSTFLRRAALERVVKLNPSYTDDLFVESDALLPFLVPLRAVEANTPLPILSYILQSYPYTRGPFGLRRLIALARKKQLLLILDGYDETSVGEPEGERLREEVDALFARDIPLHARRNKAQRDFYYCIRNCSIWLSSRKEFYANHRLLIDVKYAHSSTDEDVMRDTYLEVAHGRKLRGRREPILPTVEITGIDEQRGKLLERILERYKRREPQRYGELGAADFGRWVEREYDDDVIRMQRKPLFLTVMCELYVNSRSKDPIAGRPRDTAGARHSVRDLIGNYILLLLHGLDEYKMRDPGSSAAPVYDRLRELDQKLAFLQYFAARLFYDERLSTKQVFARKEIYDAAAEFAQDMKWAPELRKALRRRARDNIVEQLIRQEVFVAVDRTVEGDTFDFPHRLFREVLAVEYLDNPAGLQIALQRVADRSFAELLKVFFAMTYTYRDALLESVLNRITRSTTDYFTRLAVSLLENKPFQYDAGPVLRQWLRAAVEDGKISDVPQTLARYCGPDDALTAWLVTRTMATATAGEQRRALIYATVLYRLKPDIFQRVIAELSQHDSPAARSTGDRAALQHDPESFFASLQHAAAEIRDEKYRQVAALDEIDSRIWQIAVECLEPCDLDDIARRVTRPLVLQQIRGAQQRRAILQALVGHLGEIMPQFDVYRRRPGHEDEQLVVERQARDYVLTVELPADAVQGAQPRQSTFELLREARAAQNLLNSADGTFTLDGARGGLTYSGTLFGECQRDMDRYFKADLGCAPEFSRSQEPIHVEYGARIQQRYTVIAAPEWFEVVTADSIGSWCTEHRFVDQLIQLRRDGATLVLLANGVRRTKLAQ